MAIERIVNSKFTANDKITKRFGIMERAAARFGRRTEKSFKRASRSASRFSSVTKGVVAGLGITKGLALIENGISNVVTGFISFEKAARGATVRFKDIGPDAENFNTQMKTIRKSAREAGATTEFTAAQAAEALDFLARAGFTSTEAMGSLKSMIDLATASGEDFASVADMSSDLLGAFGLNAKDTGQKIANLNRLNDVLVKSANSANVTIESMFETMKLAAPIGRTLGIELEEVAALTAVMGNAGIKGSQAATALKNSFLNLSAGGPKVVNMLNAIGVRIDDGEGNMRKFTDILEDVGKKIKGLGTLKQAKVLDTLFGKRAIAGASNLIDSIAEVKQFEQTLKNAGDTSKKTADIMRQSIDARLKSLISAATEFGFKLLSAFEQDGKKGIDAITEAIRNFDPKPVIEFFMGVKEGIILIGQILEPVISLTKLVWLLVKPFVKLSFLIVKVVGLFAGSLADAINAIIIPITEFISKLDVISGLRSLLGFDELVAKAEIQSGDKTAPNQKEAAARAQQSTFKGRLDITGAPGGSKVSTDTTKEAEFELALLGA